MPLGSVAVSGGRHPASASRKATQQRRIVPIAPIAQADGLLGLARGEGQHALLAGAHEILDAEVADLALGPQAQALFHLDLDPQALAIEPVLVAQSCAVHGVIALVHVLQ